MKNRIREKAASSYKKFPSDCGHYLIDWLRTERRRPETPMKEGTGLLLEP